ncbi:polysaccharide deacetylase family protein [Virgibacillus chiguensis]|uniref:Peptidoglycan/xylan/chitin deacetylase, PgdA/CDA1 family n=1 Tax=Virgibacillus chiguensis TaxID=411959 RepID=A0A1M5T8L0_9BACI|nr:polysaccharide deacetylase family protein [Virgibacillus chiguensis]SHH47038.1 Peptidoglycan/xylan/chitin deacetylase, PgdA/CDA1 family [Virgibacillus chiguensis]
MKPTKLTYGILIVIGLIAIGLTVSSLFKSIDKDVAATHTTASSEKKAHPNYPEVQVVTEKAHDKVYSMEIDYPQFQSKKLNQKMKEFVKIAKEDFLHDVEKNKQQLKSQEATLAIRSDMQKFSDHIYSVAMHEKSCLHEKQCQDLSDIIIVDSKNSNYIDQTDILQDTEQNRDTLFQLLKHAFEQSDTYREHFSRKKLSEWVYDKDNNFSNMYLADESIVFQFDNNKVIDKEAEITIPLSKMQDVLTDEWKDMIRDESTEDSNNTENNKRTENKANTGDNDSTENNKSTEDKEDTEDKQANSAIKQEEKNSNSSSVNEEKRHSSNQKRVALTFDDGPHPQNTPKVLDLLKQYNAKATFFMLGNKVAANATVVKRMKDEGHELGNHTWSHKDLTKLGVAGIRQEIDKANEAIRNAAGKNSTLFRPPYGATNGNIEQIVGLPSILWTVDTRDWESLDPVAILNEVKSHTTDGSILLMHDIHTSTVNGMQSVLDYLVGEGYELVTVSEIRKN